MKDNADFIYIFIGVILGIAIGVFLPQLAKNLKIIGDIYLNLLKMMVVPLVLIAITGGIVNLRDIGKLKKMGLFTLGLYFFSMFIAVFVGIIMIKLFSTNMNHTISASSDFQVTKKSFADFIIGIFPSNIFKAFIDVNMLQIIFFSFLLGMAIIKVNKNIEVVSNFLNYSFEVVMQIVRWVIKVTPLGVFGLIANIVASSGLEMFLKLYGYVFSVIGGILVQGLIILPLMIYILCKENGYWVLSRVFKVLLVAFSTCSSSATLPVSMNSCVEDVKIRKDVVEFVLPLGATVNMNGTALYEAVAAIFVASIFGVNLGFMDYLTISLTSVLAAVGAAAVPGAGLVTMSIVFSAVGIPLEGIGIIVVVDRFLDMFRTSLNVWGDIAIAFIVNKKL